MPLAWLLFFLAFFRKKNCNFANFMALDMDSCHLFHRPLHPSLSPLRIIVLLAYLLFLFLFFTLSLLCFIFFSFFVFYFCLLYFLFLFFFFVHCFWQDALWVWVLFFVLIVGVAVVVIYFVSVKTGPWDVRIRRRQVSVDFEGNECCIHCKKSSKK